MKVVYKVLLVVLGSLFLYSCGSSGLVLGEVDKCYFPDSTKEKAPLWVCGASFKDYPVYSVGSSKVVNNNYEFSKTEAKVHAMGKIADNFAVSVNKMVSLSEANNNSVLDTDTKNLYAKNIKSSIETVTAQELVGVSILRTAKSKNDILYVMVGLSKDKYNLNISLFAEKLHKKSPTLEVDKIKSLMLAN